MCAPLRRRIQLTTRRPSLTTNQIKARHEDTLRREELAAAMGREAARARSTSADKRERWARTRSTLRSAESMRHLEASALHKRREQENAETMLGTSLRQSTRAWMQVSKQ